MMQNEATTVFVGLSGGVDSSVAALRLKKQGYTVVGVFIKVWHPDFLECNWEQERLDAMRVAAKLDIPFLTCDAQKAYKDDVAEYFIQEYKAGRTPNPDVMCNKYVKFGAFLSFAQKQGADYIATGHYAQNIKHEDTHALLRGIDGNKDQSYFLWTLTQEQLSHVLLPVGNATKDVIRREARIHGLATASKKDSQGICFLGHVDIAEFLSHYVDLTEGAVLDVEGKRIGIHKGALVYTTGQRHGFTITEESAARTPHYVVSRDIARNTIIVDTKPSTQEMSSSITLTHTNYISWTPKVGNTIEIQTRYRQKPQTCTIVNTTETALELAYAEQGERVSVGQSCVLYDGIVCCGGGIIAL
jgi:tRNA-uridine 2-sulfurtransferase